MSIRQGLNTTLPPRGYLDQIMDSVTRLYCFLWDRKDSQNRIEMKWNEVCEYYHRHAFRSGMRKLLNQGLLSYEESDDGISIELVGWDEIDSAS
ncbi:MAG: hypothetical protein ACHQ1H_04060 [Nitrososphaerales archaeon]